MTDWDRDVERNARRRGPQPRDSDQHLQLRRDVACVALPVSLLGRARYCGYFGILSRMAVLSAILS